METMNWMNSIYIAIGEYTRAEEKTPDHVIAVLEQIRHALNNDAQFIVPVEMPPEALAFIEKNNPKSGDILQSPEELHFKMRSISLDDNTEVLAAFTSHEEVEKGATTSTITCDAGSFLETVMMNPDLYGFVINPWGDPFYVPKSYIRDIYEANLPAPGENVVHIGVYDITKANVACIVNAANESLLGGGGVDGAIHKAAGPELLAECKNLGGCKTGQAKLTRGYNLPAEYIIHTVGPIYKGRKEDADNLYSCYFNSLELARKNDIHSIAFPAISTGVYGYPVEEATDIACKAVTDWSKLFPDYGMAVMFACFNESTCEIYKKTYDRYLENWNDRDIRENNSDFIIEKAITFATEKHKGAFRKGTDRPYILHPMEVAQILNAMSADPNLIAAGLLHDTLEDTDTTLKEIVDEFGLDVAALVCSHTEDKRRSWYERKLRTITEVPYEHPRLKMLTLADKLSNIRSIARDYMAIGPKLWDRFNAPKNLQAWYYSGIVDGLAELQHYTETRDAYWELNGLFKDLFVAYFLDEDKEMMYQVCETGENFVLKKGKPRWFKFDGKIPKKAECVYRKVAERIEDNWADPFWKLHQEDLADGAYTVYLQGDDNCFINIEDGSLIFTYENFTKAPNPAPVAEYFLSPEETDFILTELRMKHGMRNKLSTIFKNEFGREDSAMTFLQFCDEMGITPQTSRF